MTQPWPGLQPRHSLLTFSNGWRIKESCCDRLALQRYLRCGVIPSVLHLRESLTKAPSSCITAQPDPTDVRGLRRLVGCQQGHWPLLAVGCGCCPRALESRN